MSRIALLSVGRMVSIYFWNLCLSLYFCSQVLVLRQHRQGVPPDLPLGHGVRVRGILDFSSEDQSEKEKQAESIHQHLENVE